MNEPGEGGYLYFWSQRESVFAKRSTRSCDNSVPMLFSITIFQGWMPDFRLQAEGDSHPDKRPWGVTSLSLYSPLCPHILLGRRPFSWLSKSDFPTLCTYRLILSFILWSGQTPRGLGGGERAGGGGGGRVPILLWSRESVFSKMTQKGSPKLTFHLFYFRFSSFFVFLFYFSNEGVCLSASGESPPPPKNLMGEPLLPMPI